MFVEFEVKFPEELKDKSHYNCTVMIETSSIEKIGLFSAPDRDEDYILKIEKEDGIDGYCFPTYEAAKKVYDAIRLYSDISISLVE